MAKFQSFQNSNRYDQNVGKVLISRKMALINSKHSFWAKISLILFSLNFGTHGGPPIGPLFGRQAFFFAHTGRAISTALCSACSQDSKGTGVETDLFLFFETWFVGSISTNPRLSEFLMPMAGFARKS